ncbi:MAG TPA: Mur ligase family protein [Allosphingosinicella sp.]|jgi:UDP-N-acetylmuramate--alanine ligase
MAETKSYFFCGIGGSGMLPLASIVRASGGEVAGSDRALDQGRTAAKFEYLRRLGIDLYPQDGSGPAAGQILVASAAVEDSVPDIRAAGRLGLERITRAELLARLFNSAPVGIAVGGTSGKSTVTGMIGWILHGAGLDPTVMNGAVMKNFATSDAPFASALVGGGGVFVSEVDESDGSIALYRPKIALLNNVSLDHKSLDELRALFGDFLGTAETAVLNLDDPETRALAAELPAERRLTFAFGDGSADLRGSGIQEAAGSIGFRVADSRTGEELEVRIPLWGAHNARNALAALAAASAAGVPLAEAGEALAGFRGLRRRFEEVGERRGVLVIDDFGHNPDKISATLDAARIGLEGRLLLFFQPHGFGPLRAMRSELVDAFAGGMEGDDVLLLPDPAYYGGTVERSVTSADIVSDLVARGRLAEHAPDRSEARRRLGELARRGDRILVMGARDDSLSQFAEDVLAEL